MKAPANPLPQATLQELGTQPTNPQPVGDPIQVQFNPTTLRLSMQNSVDMKKAFGKRPATQYDGTSSSTLTFDLIFDCTDDGSSQDPVDVRGMVTPIEKFLLPAPGQRKSIPPRVQFTYGTFQLIGVMTGLNAEYDLFAASGVPLRARLNVTIKEQLPEYEQGAVGSGSNTGAGAQDPQNLVPAGGTAPIAPDQTGTAVAGESAPDFAARMGLDPSDWKALDLVGLNPLALTAGAAIDFSASISVDLGVTAGFAAGAAGPSAAFGGGSVGAGVVGAGPVDPSAITAAGGLQAALDSAARRSADDAAYSARAGFGAPDPGTGSGPSGSGPSGSGPAPTDRRGLTFGFGVPMRPTLGGPNPFGRLPDPFGRSTGPDTPGHPAGKQIGPAGAVPTSADPSVPGWVALRPAAGGGPGSPGCPCGGHSGARPGQCTGACEGRCGSAAGSAPAPATAPIAAGAPYATTAFADRPAPVSGPARTAGWRPAATGGRARPGGSGGCRGCG